METKFECTHVNCARWLPEGCKLTRCKNYKTTKRQRRTGIKHGEIRQKPFTFRIDNENLYYLESLGITNKGRFINEGIQHYIKHKKL